MKEFCIAGPVIPEDHYYIPQRLNWKQLDQFISSKYYFVLHAPRQSGKTTAIEEYVRHLNSVDKFYALYINIEDAQAARDNVEKALLVLVSILKETIERSSKDGHEIGQKLQKLMQSQPVTVDLFRRAVELISREFKKPVVLFVDEIDSLIGDSLLSVLRQIRAGFIDRPKGFPQSLCLIGLRDVRDYRIWSRDSKDFISTSSPFNIKAESLTLSNFTLEQVRNLYLQHTTETGQKFTDEAIEYAHYLTQGQPWLVNALAYQACFRDVIDRSRTIDKAAIERAREQLIARRDTHIDSLFDKLNEERVRVIIDAIINGRMIAPNYTDDDLQYVQDLGLISAQSKGLVIANPIYQEIIPAALAYKFQKSITQETKWYVDDNGSLNMQKLLVSFTQFFRENSQAWLSDFKYKESGPHILMMAFLQRIINGGGSLHREYALGKKRVDLLVTWPGQRIVIELKIKYGQDTLSKGLEQTAKYMSTSGASEGHLVIFDRDSKKSWEEKISNEIVTFADKKIHIWTL